MTDPQDPDEPPPDPVSRLADSGLMFTIAEQARSGLAINSPGPSPEFRRDRRINRRWRIIIIIIVGGLVLIGALLLAVFVH